MHACLLRGGWEHGMWYMDVVRGIEWGGPVDWS